MKVNVQDKLNFMFQNRGNYLLILPRLSLCSHVMTQLRKEISKRNISTLMSSGALRVQLDYSWSICCTTPDRLRFHLQGRKYRGYLVAENVDLSPELWDELDSRVRYEEHKVDSFAWNYSNWEQGPQDSYYTMSGAFTRADWTELVEALAEALRRRHGTDD